MINNAEMLFEFIKKSPSAYHTVSAVSDMLAREGYTELSEGDLWSLEAGGRYFVIKNGTSLIAFRNTGGKSFTVTASHSDSPTFRVKTDSDFGTPYLKLPVERYGGMLLYSWLDRPLSFAGRVIIRSGTGVEVRLINVDKDLLVIPSVAIHLNRTANEKLALNPAQDMIPLMSVTNEKISLNAIIARELGVSESDVLGHDLFLYVRDGGKTVGLNGEIIVSPRLDDLECVYASTVAFLGSSEQADTIPVLAIFDNEEVGSDTKQGAASSFLADTLHRIVKDTESYLAALASGFMVSADNAHARHPNHPELSDGQNAPVLNGGVVIKFNANQKYATDALSSAIFKTVCEGVGVPTQSYYNRADMIGGSTLGSIANTKVPISTVDVGLPQLAMHSANETAGVRDLDYMITALTRLYSSKIEVGNSKTIIK